MTHDIVKRYSGDPILTKAEIPYPVETVHNAAVVKHGNEYIMLFRSNLRTGRSIIGELVQRFLRSCTGPPNHVFGGWSPKNSSVF